MIDTPLQNIRNITCKFYKREKRTDAFLVEVISCLGFWNLQTVWSYSKTSLCDTAQSYSHDNKEMPN